MNGDDLVMDVHINIKTAFEALGGLQSKQIAIFNNTADVIRQSAVGIRYISRPLKHNNLSGIHPTSGDAPRRLLLLQRRRQ